MSTVRIEGVNIYAVLKRKNVLIHILNYVIINTLSVCLTLKNILNAWKLFLGDGFCMCTKFGCTLRHIACQRTYVIYEAIIYSKRPLLRLRPLPNNNELSAVKAHCTRKSNCLLSLLTQFWRWIATSLKWSAVAPTTTGLDYSNALPHETSASSLYRLQITTAGKTTTTASSSSISITVAIFCGCNCRCIPVNTSLVWVALTTVYLYFSQYQFLILFSF